MPKEAHWLGSGYNVAAAATFGLGGLLRGPVSDVFADASRGPRGGRGQSLRRFRTSALTASSRAKHFRMAFK